MTTKKITIVTVLALAAVAIAVVAVHRKKEQPAEQVVYEQAAESELTKALSDTGMGGSVLPRNFPRALAAAPAPVEKSERIELPRAAMVYTFTVHADPFTTRTVYTSSLKRDGWSQFETKTPLGFDLRVATGTTEAVISIAKKSGKSEASSVQILLYE